MPEQTTPAIQSALNEALNLLQPLAGQETYNPAVPAALVQAGLHRLPLPVQHGGLGGRMGDVARVLAAVGAVDGAAALGLAMHCHTLGAAAESRLWPQTLLENLWRQVCEDGALVNLTATEDSGSPARGTLPATVARRHGGGWRLDGEKSWATWLPALRYAVVTAGLDDGEPGGRIGALLVDLNRPGVERLPAFDGLGMQASASGVLRLSAVDVDDACLIYQRQSGAADPRSQTPLAWFGLCVAAVYLGVGEGARAAVLRWARTRKPGDTGQPVANLPSVRLRLGRLDAALRAARIVLLDTARRWDKADSHTARTTILPDVALAKLQATQAAAYATDECLRIAGGPGFLRGELERAFRDARAGLIHPPLEDVAYLEFARALVESGVAA
ncbi:MAG: acyl-CoA dehydrogenase family protein [Candidatus Methylumidiphilus sp.]